MRHEGVDASAAGAFLEHGLEDSTVRSDDRAEHATHEGGERHRERAPERHAERTARAPRAARPSRQRSQPGEEH